MSENDVDSLDAYMASLQLPGDQAQSMTQARAEYNTGRSHVQSGRSVTVKNRRYRRLQQLLDDREEGQYFSDNMMQQRSPALFHFYLGQYLGPGRSDTSLGNGGQTLSSFLMATCQRKEMETRRVVEQETWGKFIPADEKQERDRLERLYEEGNIEEDEEDEEEESEEESEEEDTVDFSVQERRQLLIEIMSSRFLDGKDHEYVNYAEIDADERLNDFGVIQRDAEDRYRIIFLASDSLPTPKE